MGATIESPSSPAAPLHHTGPPPHALRPWLGGLYSPPRTPVIVDVPPVSYLVRTGEGPPEGNLAWATAVDLLRAEWRDLLGENGSGIEQGPLLEVLWHDPEQRRWTVMLALGDPSWRPRESAPQPAAVRHLHEGWCAQLLYYGTPGPAGAAGREAALARLDRFVTRQGYRVRSDGVLHEIFLDDAATPAPRVIARRRVQPGS